MVKKETIHYGLSSLKNDQLKTKASFNLVLTYHKLVEAEAVQLQDTIRKAIILMKYINPAISRSWLKTELEYFLKM